MIQKGSITRKPWQPTVETCDCHCGAQFKTDSGAQFFVQYMTDYGEPSGEIDSPHFIYRADAKAFCVHLNLVLAALRFNHAVALMTEEVASHALPGKSNHPLAADARRAQAAVEKVIPELRVTICTGDGPKVTP